METTERVVEAYVRYVKGWFTLPNIKCKGQLEIDLLAIQSTPSGRIRRYHIESGVSISGAYSALTTKPYSADHLKVRVMTAGQRRTLGYFMERKFGSKAVRDTIKNYGFRPGNYRKVIVSWGWSPGVLERAKRSKIELWDFREILKEISGKASEKRSYFTDDTMRTLQLMSYALK